MGVVAVGRLAAICAGCIIWVATLIEALLMFGVVGGGFPRNYAAYRVLDETYIRQLWEYRRKTFAYTLAVRLLLALVFALTVVSMIAFKDVLKKFGRRFLAGTRRVMIYCFLFGAIIPIMEFLQSAGIQNAADRMSVHNLNGEEIRSLEVAYRVVEGGQGWLFAIDYVVVSVGVGLCSWISQKTPGTLKKWHWILGYILAVVGILAFCFEIARIGWRPMGMAYGISVLLWGVILLPIWLFGLGAQLGPMARRAPEEQDDLQLVQQQENSVV